MSQTATEIRWKLIFLLAPFGLLHAFLIHQEFYKSLPLWVTYVFGLLVLPGAIAGWIVKHVQDRYFLHGFLAGFCYHGIGSTGWFVIGYLGKTSAFQDSLALQPNVAFDLVTSSTIGGIPLGLYYGFFAWMAGKIVNPPVALASKWRKRF